MVYTESVLLGLAVAALIVALLAFFTWAGVRYSFWGKREMQIMAGLAIVLAIPAGVGVYHLDTRQRQVTLYEVEIDAAETTSWQFTFEVESPEIEHKLRIAPKPYLFSDAEQPLSIAVSLRDGPDPPLEAVMDFPLRVEYSGRDNLSRSKHVRWESAWMGFIPSQTGVHELTLRLLSGHPERLLIRIEDPTKTDGKRTEGY